MNKRRLGGSELKTAAALRLDPEAVALLAAASAEPAA